jgi:hypothetical protein
MTADADKENAAHAGLLTRHVFLDTEVYRAHEHDLTSAPFKALAGLIEEGRLTLHVTDITLSEVERHVREQAAEIGRSVRDLAKKLERWKRRAPRASGLDCPILNAETLAKAANSAFAWTVKYEWNAESHRALDISAHLIFDGILPGRRRLIRLTARSSQTRL